MFTRSGLLTIASVKTIIIKGQKVGVIVMQSIFWSVEEVALRAKQFYENDICQHVEYGDNIGKMIAIDAETGEYGIDPTGRVSASQ